MVDGAIGRIDSELRRGEPAGHLVAESIIGANAAAMLALSASKRVSPPSDRIARVSSTTAVLRPLKEKS
jgi:hypothetical protein